MDINTEKHIDLNKLLTIDFSLKKPIEMSKKTSSMNGVLYLGDSTPNPPWKTDQYRSPWELLDDNHLKGMNFIWTLNCDPAVENYANTKKVQIPLLLNLLDNIKFSGDMQKSIVVYEWGKQGKRHGKLHFHGMLKTHNKNQVTQEFLKVFNSRLAISHRTFHIKHVRTVDDRTRYLNYMKKEQQNKKRCLYYN